MRIRNTTQGLIATKADGGRDDRWVSVETALRGADAGEEALAAADSGSMLTLLADPELRAVTEEAVAVAADEAGSRTAPDDVLLPFEMRSMRAFSVWESHMIGSARTIAKRFLPAPVSKAAAGYERLTGRTFPPFKPKEKFYEVPAFYMGNHTAVLADGEPVEWPSHTHFLDFELELACVLAGPVEPDCSPAEGEAAIGGWFVLNDWSARDVQADDYRRSVFGPVVKSKTFANSIGADVVTPEQLGPWDQVSGRVLVDGELWCEGSTAGAAHSIGEMIAEAARGERLGSGDVISTGTMPGCCGLELDRWIQPGQTVRLEIDGLGSLETPISGGPRG